MGIGKPNKAVYITAIQLFFFLISVFYLMDKFQIVGVGYSLIFANTAAIIVNFSMLKRSIKISFYDILRTNLSTVIGTVPGFWMVRYSSKPGRVQPSAK